jgi:hypothetical protein
VSSGSPSRRRAVAAALALCALTACGKKGPPLAPLRPLPGPVTELTARRAGDDVRFTFRLPAQNLDKTSPVSLSRIEVYAATVAADAPAPPNRDLLLPKYLVATIPVRAAATEEDPVAPPTDPVAPPTETVEGKTETVEKKDDPGPAPGEIATFAEELNEARLKPQVLAPTVPAVQAPPTTTTVAAAWAATVGLLKEVPVASRIYVIRGVSRHGRPGQPSERATVPVSELPAPPTSVTAAFTESRVTLVWSAPVPEGLLSVLAPAPVFNVYHATGTSPLNAQPLAALTFERDGLTVGTEECFVVRTAIARGNVTIESTASAPACVTPLDIFPPAAPAGLTAVATTGAVNLIWEANTESDLAGYLVLRGEAPGDTLQAITAAPIRDTTYRDATATPGVRYIYAVVAVDRATPPNTSPQSARVEETAR